MNDDDRMRAARFQFGGLDLPTQVEAWARGRGEHPFLLWEPRSGRHRIWTYAAFDREVRSIAAGLARHGIGVGDRVLIHSDNCPEMVFAWYACAAVGAMAVTTNTGSVANEMQYFARQARPRAAITQPRHARLVQENAPGLDWMAVTADNGGEEPAGAECNHAGMAFEELLGDPDLAPRRAPDPMLPAGIVYTSGTTSRPKAVVHTHANLLWAGRIGPATLNFTGADTHMAYMPFFHTNAQLWSTAVALGVGGSVLLLPQVTVSRFWDVVAKHGVTHMSLMPLVERGVAEIPVPAGQRLKVVQGGIAPVEFARRCGARPMAAYGMSETVIHTIRTDVWRDWPPYALGRPTPGYEVRLVDAQRDAGCGIDEPGEIQVRGIRGMHLFLEYYDNPEANAQAFTADGWFRTGDIARLGADGLFYYQDRDKDRLKVGGENLSASEVEAEILQVPGVVEAAVVGRSDPMLDVVPVAFVIRGAAAPDEAALRAAIFARCGERLSKFKRPRAVHFLDEFPRALLGKVAKNRLRELAEQAGH
ncbi:MAG: class I adenylate-forming enzyme family protein [Gammaproteobacteria bacterium]